MHIFTKLLLANCFGIILNDTLEVLLRVFMGLKYDDVTFWEEVPQQKGVETGEYCQSVKSLDVLSTVKHGCSGKDDPGEDQQEQAEGYCFGLIVIFWEIFSHVGENEAKAAQGHK